MDGTGMLFYRQVPLLARSYRVATYALRDGADAMHVLVEDLARVVDTVSPDRERAVIVGESFGGALALSFALARPDRVSALVIVNSFPYFAPRFQLHLAIAGLGLMPWGVMRLVRRLTAFRMHSPHTHADDLRQFMALTAQTTREGYVGRLKLLATYDVRRELATLAMPTLFLAADRDHLVPAVTQARFMAARVPRATLRVLNGYGHVCLIAPDLDLERLIGEWRVSLRVDFRCRQTGGLMSRQPYACMILLPCFRRLSGNPMPS
jgi:pimeloyl-ACP methyl ester carboxylesterase